MTDSNEMVVVLENEDGVDMSFEQSVFEDAGIRVKNAIPKADLEELIEEWQKAPGETTPEGQSAIYHICADELQKVLDKYD